MPPKKKGSSKGKKVKPPSAAELAEQSRVALEAEMLAVRSYITGAISSALSEALDSAVERERGGRARDVTAATYVYMVERAVGALQPRLIRDEGDCVMGEVKRGEMDEQEEEPRPADIDRMATAAVVRKDELSDFCRTQRMTMRGSMDEGEVNVTPKYKSRSPTKPFKVRGGGARGRHEVGLGLQGTGGGQDRGRAWEL